MILPLLTYPLILLSLIAAGDMIYLKTGEIIQGVIIHQDEHYVEMDIGENILLQFPLRSILRIKEVSNDRSFSHKGQEKLIHWLKSHLSPQTKLPYSFFIPEGKKPSVFSSLGRPDSITGVIERNIVREGLVIYDCALWQIVLTLLGEGEDLELASIPIQYFWEGKLREFIQIRAGYPQQPFVYDLSHPQLVSSNLSDYGKRGFLFRIINANGTYLMSDPLDGKTSIRGFPNGDMIHWEDWKPVAGENAWVVLASLHLFHKKYFNPQTQRYEAFENAVELRLAEELARAAIILQAENGAVRMAPLGTYYNPMVRLLEETDNPEEVIKAIDQYTLRAPPLDFHKRRPSDYPEEYRWYYYEISTENNLSWLAAFRMLYQITFKKEYQKAISGIENYLKKAWNKNRNFFYQGMHYNQGQWIPNTKHFASDVQNGVIMVLGPQWIEETFGEGTAFQLWLTTKRESSFVNEHKELMGIGFSHEHDRLTVEWTAGAILAVRQLASYYEKNHPSWAEELKKDAQSMRKGIERFKYTISSDETAYSYSSKRGWIPFGWFSHVTDVLSLSASCWVILVDQNINPFVLEQAK